MINDFDKRSSVYAVSLQTNSHQRELNIFAELTASSSGLTSPGKASTPGRNSV